MLSRVQWLKEYQKQELCINDTDCLKSRTCKNCAYSSKYNLQEEAAEIFKAQVMTDKGIIDDGK